MRNAFGHGRSFDPTHEPTVDFCAQAVQSVMDHLDIGKAHIVGHHGGSLIAVNLLAQQPERFDKAVLSGIGGPRTPQKNEAFLNTILNTDTKIRHESDFVAGAWDRCISMMSDGGRPRDILKPYMAFLDARLRPHRSIPASIKWDRSTALSKLTGPVLLLHGEKDHYVKGQDSLLSIIPFSQRIVVKGGGAFMFYDMPETCAKIVSEYLSGKTRGGSAFPIK